MMLFVLSFGVVLLAVLGMALGVIARDRPIHAGCGGFPDGTDDDGVCEVCQGSCTAERDFDTGPGLSSRGQG